MARDRVIAVINSKGGVGKTTVAANLAGTLAHAGAGRILLVDMDPQGNLGEDLGYSSTDIDDAGRALSAALSFSFPVTPAQDVRPNLDVIVGGEELVKAANTLESMLGSRDPGKSKSALARVLDPLVDDYDLTIIDCPPGYPSLQRAALAASGYFVIPVKTDAASRKGLRDVAELLDNVLDVNANLDMLGIVMFGVNRAATRVTAQARDLLVQDFAGDETRVFNTTIRASETVAQDTRQLGKLAHELEEVVRSGPSWWELRRTGKKSEGPRTASAEGVADDFHHLAEEVLRRLAAAESAMTADGSPR